MQLDECGRPRAGRGGASRTGGDSAEAAANNAQKAAEAASVAALRAQKAVEDADREITAVEKRLDQLLKKAPKKRRSCKRHRAPATPQAQP